MKTARIFLSGHSQAVRLPKEFRLPGDRVVIRREGEGLLLLPYSGSWQPLLDSLSLFTPDFMAERCQPAEAQEREAAFP